MPAINLFRKGAVTIYGGGGANKGGHNFQCKQIEGGQNFSAETFEGQPKATKICPKIFATASAADIFQYTTVIFQANFALSGFS